MFSKLLLVAALGVAAAHPSFEAFLKAHPTKQYAASELAYRRALYYASVDKVAKANADPAHTFASAVNAFSDMTPAEVKAMKGYSGYQAGESVMGAGVEGLTEMAMPAGFLDDLVDVAALPASVDWRTKGVVSPTKNQGGCGSCWAFSATEVMESAVAIASGKLLVLAPQQLVSCAPNPNDCGGTGGCQGSVQWLGFNYTQHMGGMTLEKDYPYQGSTGTCDTSSIKPAAGVKGYVRLPANNYTALMNAVARVGPVAISVDASWGAYSGGVFNGACGTTIDHAVVLVGYGTDPNGGDYYLVRNSWGEGWGEGGYIRIQRKDSDSSNCGIDSSPDDGTVCKDPVTHKYPKSQKVCGLCGILSDSSYPTGAFVV